MTDRHLAHNLTCCWDMSKESKRVQKKLYLMDQQMGTLKDNWKLLTTVQHDCSSFFMLALLFFCHALFLYTGVASLLFYTSVVALFFIMALLLVCFFVFNADVLLLFLLLLLVCFCCLFTCVFNASDVCLLFCMPVLWPFLFTSLFLLLPVCYFIICLPVFLSASVFGLFCLLVLQPFLILSPSCFSSCWYAVILVCMPVQFFCLSVVVFAFFMAVLQLF